MCHTPDRVESNRAAFIALGAKLTRDVAAMRPLVASAIEQASLDTIDSEVANWTRLYGRYLDLAIQKDFQRAHEIMVGQIYLVLPKITGAADALNAEQEKLLAESRIAAEHQVALTFGAVSLAVALGLLAGFAGLWVVRQVGRSLRGSATQLTEMSRKVASEAEEIARSNEELARGVTEQAASLEETSAATAEINAMTQQNLAGFRDVAQLARADADLAAGASNQLEDLTASMRDIAASGSKISTIVKTIDGIAFHRRTCWLSTRVWRRRAPEKRVWDSP